MIDLGQTVRNVMAAFPVHHTQRFAGMETMELEFSGAFGGGPRQLRAGYHQTTGDGERPAAEATATAIRTIEPLFQHAPSPWFGSLLRASMALPRRNAPDMLHWNG